MNKFAEQFNNDVITRYQQKMAALVKRAEEEIPDLIPQTQEEKDQTAKHLKDMSPRRAAEAIDFESRVFAPLLNPDSKYDTPGFNGFREGIPERSIRTSTELASGMSLPKPPAGAGILTRILPSLPLSSELESLNHSSYEALSDAYANKREGFKPLSMAGENLTPYGRNGEGDINNYIRKAYGFYK